MAKLQPLGVCKNSKREILIKNFADLANFLIETDIIDNKYPVKGCYIWLPYGVAIRERMVGLFKKPLQERNYEEYLFPRLMHKDFLRGLGKIIKSPEKGLFWVSDTSKSKKELFLYPTGEAAIYNYFKKKITSFQDLPVNLFQVSSIFRPTKDTSIIINGAESDTLLEVHTAHATEKESLRAFEESQQIMREYYAAMLLPVISVKRPLWGNKPVSETTISYEMYLPVKNRSFSPSVTYHQSQVFSRAFEIKFRTESGGVDYTYQNTYGIAERVLAAVFLIHLDEDGLRLPPLLAPFQVVIIPYFDKNNEGAIMKVCGELKERLSEYRPFVDSKKTTPCKRIYSWRKKGVPLCITVDSKSMSNGNITVSRRDARKKEIIPFENAAGWCKNSLEAYSAAIYCDAKKYMGEKMCAVKGIDELAEVISQRKLGRFSWCCEKECGLAIEEKVVGEILGEIQGESPEVNCFCGKPAKAVVLYGRRCTSP